MVLCTYSKDFSKHKIQVQNWMLQNILVRSKKVECICYLKISNEIEFLLKINKYSYFFFLPIMSWDVYFLSCETLRDMLGDINIIYHQGAWDISVHKTSRYSLTELVISTHR